MKKVEFSGLRSRLYKECQREFPDARREDLELMLRHFDPQPNENVLEVGAGAGFFSKQIAERVSALWVSDASNEQLKEIESWELDNVNLVPQGADDLSLEDEFLDGIWSFGAFHHVGSKTRAFKHFHRMLKAGGRLVVADVFQGSKLAEHFDSQVARYCLTGHEVSFLSQDFCRSLCHLVGFDEPEFHDVDLRWHFNSKEALGLFLWKLHAMTKQTPEECLKAAERILGVETYNAGYSLNWPMTVFTTKKGVKHQTTRVLP